MNSATATAHQQTLFDDNDLIHSPDRIGYFSIFRKNEGQRPSQRSYVLSMLPEVLRAIGDTPDCYISQGEFKRPNRRMMNLLRMGVCFIDLDFYNSDCSFKSSQHLVESLLMHCNDIGLPLPSIIIDSGRGAYAKWILDRPVPAAALPRWNAVQRLLLDKVEGFGADRNAADSSRVLRIVGTRNSKNGKPVSILWENPSNLTYDFEYLATEVLPLTRENYRQEWRQNNQKSTIKQQNLFEVKKVQLEQDRCVVRRIFNPYTLNWSRLTDLRTLVSMRGWTQGIQKGKQDQYLFLGACFLSWSMKVPRLHQEVEQLAIEFCPTWTKQERMAVLSTTLKRAKQADNGEFVKYVAADKMVDPRYKWTTSRLIADLEITPEEQQSMLTIIGTPEKYRRRREKRSEQRREDYLANSLSQQKPWEALDMSRAKWYRLGKPTE